MKTYGLITPFKNRVILLSVSTLILAGRCPAADLPVPVVLPQPPSQDASAWMAGAAVRAAIQLVMQGLETPQETLEWNRSVCFRLGDLVGFVAQFSRVAARDLEGEDATRSLEALLGSFVRLGAFCDVGFPPPGGESAPPRGGDIAQLRINLQELDQVIERLMDRLPTPGLTAR